MPTVDIHAKASLERTGKDYREVHEWLDRDAMKKAERHDLTRIPEYAATIQAQWGQEGVQEYIQHLHDDLEAKFNHVVDDLRKDMAETLAYFGVKPGVARSTGYTIKETDIDILRRAGVPQEAIQHSVAVSKKALEIAGRCGQGLDLGLIGRGALFHDLGKAKTNAIEHGQIGAKLGIELGLPAELTDIMEKHIRGGLSPEEARELGLPLKDYSPNRLEERIVIYADRLVDIIADGIVPLNSELEAEERFEQILRDHTEYGKNEKTILRYLSYHREIQGIMKGR